MITTSLYIFMTILGALSTVGFLIGALESETGRGQGICGLGAIFSIALLSFGLGGLIHLATN